MNLLFVLLAYVALTITIMTVMVIAVSLRHWNSLKRLNKILSMAEIHADISDRTQSKTCKKIDELKETTLEAAAEVKKTTAASFDAVDKKIDENTNKIIGLATGDPGGSGIVEPMSPHFRRMLAKQA